MIIMWCKWYLHWNCSIGCCTCGSEAQERQLGDSSMEVLSVEMLAEMGSRWDGSGWVYRAEKKNLESPVALGLAILKAVAKCLHAGIPPWKLRKNSEGRSIFSELPKFPWLGTLTERTNVLKQERVWLKIQIIWTHRSSKARIFRRKGVVNSVVCLKE